MQRDDNVPVAPDSNDRRRAEVISMAEARLRVLRAWPGGPGQLFRQLSEDPRYAPLMPHLKKMADDATAYVRIRLQRREAGKKGAPELTPKQRRTIRKAYHEHIAQLLRAKGLVPGRAALEALDPGGDPNAPAAWKLHRKAVNHAARVAGSDHRLVERVILGLR